MEAILGILLIFGGGTLVALSFSPLGHALAERLRGGRRAVDRTALAAQREELLEAVDLLRREVTELAERVDFTERLLARRPEPGALPRSD
jgi:hypothetical protein